MDKTPKQKRPETMHAMRIEKHASTLLIYNLEKSQKFADNLRGLKRKIDKHN